jgi:DNA-binding protein H-NS
MEFKKVSQRKRSLVVQLRELTGAELEVFEKNYIEAKEIVWAEKAESARREDERSAKKEAIIKMMKDEGMSIDDFSEVSKTKSGEKRKAVPPKYSITIDGKEITWTGRGITPKVFVQYKESNTMDQFAI